MAEKYANRNLLSVMRSLPLRNSLRSFLSRGSSRNLCTSLSLFSLRWERAPFNGVTVDLSLLQDDYTKERFTDEMKGSIQKWRKDRKKAIWLKVPVRLSHLIPEAYNNGFTYHHAHDNYAMLLKWLPSHLPCKVPAYATHQVGVSGIVLNKDKQEVLVVQDKQKVKMGHLREPIWKFPGGLADDGEDIAETAAREIWEETGIRSEFQSVLLFRHQHKMRIAFDKSDIYVICRMKPLTFDISLCEEEIAKCQWMQIDKLLYKPDTTPLVKTALRLILHGMKNGFENVDITATEMKSWVDPTRTFQLYNRPLPQ